MPRKKELPAPDSGEQDDLLPTEPQEEPIPTESPPDEGAPEDDTPSEESSGVERISRTRRPAAPTV